MFLIMDNLLMLTRESLCPIYAKYGQGISRRTSKEMPLQKSRICPINPPQQPHIDTPSGFPRLPSMKSSDANPANAQ